MYKQMSKKYETAIEEERMAHQRKLNKMEANWKLKVEQVEETCMRKDLLISEMKEKLSQSEKEKCLVIEESTRMLC